MVDCNSERLTPVLTLRILRISRRKLELPPGNANIMVDISNTAHRRIHTTRRVFWCRRIGRTHSDSWSALEDASVVGIFTEELFRRCHVF